MTEERKTFVMMIGTPGCGKSTFLTDNLNYKDYIVISTDDLVEREAAKIGKKYNDVWKDVINDVTKEVDILFKQSIQDGKNIISDQTNTTLKKRKYILGQLPKYYYKIAVQFTASFDIIKERLEKREKETGKHIPWNVVMDMNNRLEPPTLEEGFNEILLV